MPRRGARPLKTVPFCPPLRVSAFAGPPLRVSGGNRGILTKSPPQLSLQAKEPTPLSSTLCRRRGGKGDSLFFRDGRHRSDQKGAGSFGCQDDSGGPLVKFPRLLPETRGLLIS